MLARSEAEKIAAERDAARLGAAAAEAADALAAREGELAAAERKAAHLQCGLTLTALPALSSTPSIYQYIPYTNSDFDPIPTQTLSP